jgi:hypothetical protein
MKRNAVRIFVVIFLFEQQSGLPKDQSHFAFLKLLEEMNFVAREMRHRKAPLF